MDAPTLSLEQRRELERLRRRAYGPGADIAADPRALERLAALEAASRTSAEPESPPAPTPAVWRTGVVPAPVSRVDIDEEPASDVASDRSDEDAVAAASPSTSRPWTRRVPRSRWFFGALALLVVAAIVWGVGRITESRPDVSLAPVAAGTELPEPFLQQGFTGYYEIAPESFQSYESFRSLRVWSATTTGGARCLLVVTEQFRFNSQVSCTPQGLDPTIDYTVWPGLPPEIAQGLAQGSVFRFVLQDDRVHVWVRAADGTVRS